MQIFVREGGAWEPTNDAHIRHSDSWKSVLYESGSQAFTSTGSSTFTVPAGVVSLTATVVGGGGGAGGSYSSGDWWTGGAGGSGGYINASAYSVTPGESLTITVGSGGLRASQYFNGWYQTEPSPMNGTAIGQAGSDSAIQRSSTDIARATGGGAGLAGDSNCGGNAAGGTPNGDQGDQRGGLCYGYGYSGTQYGGVNGSGYGSGGNVQRNQNANHHGGDGYINLVW